jgi:hypothetical protein
MTATTSTVPVLAPYRVSNLSGSLPVKLILSLAALLALAACNVPLVPLI